MIRTAPAGRDAAGRIVARRRAIKGVPAGPKPPDFLGKVLKVSRPYAYGDFWGASMKRPDASQASGQVSGEALPLVIGWCVHQFLCKRYAGWRRACRESEGPP
jgi:hypothetical protein